MSDYQLFAVYINEQVHYYSAFDIACLVELEVLGLLDYYFCFDKKQWLNIDNNDLIIEALSLNFKKINESKLKDSLSGPPRIIPDEPNERKVFSLLNKIIDQQLINKKRRGPCEEVLFQKKIKELENKIIQLEKAKDAKKYRETTVLSTEENETENECIYGWEDLIGEVFEVIDKPVWLIKREGKQHGPYCFSDLYGQYKNNELSPKSLIKKDGDLVFNRISEVYEFNTKVFRRIEYISGEKIESLFVKRTDYRVPFYEVIELTLGELKWKGHCTNLSTGGCYIEFTHCPEELIMNGVVELEMRSKVLSSEVRVKGIIKNVQRGRSCGMGCEFLDLKAQQRDSISKYVEGFLNQNIKDEAS